MVAAKKGRGPRRTQRNRRWDLGDKRRRGEKGSLLGNSPVWEEENCLSSAMHPLWPRILEHVYKKAMREISP